MIKKIIYISLFLPIISQANNIYCFEPIDDVNIFSVTKSTDFKLDSYQESTNYNFCITEDEEFGRMPRSKSLYQKIGPNTYISYINNDLANNIETVQIDKENKIIKYSKNLVISPDSYLSVGSGIAVHTWKYKLVKY